MKWILVALREDGSILRIKESDFDESKHQRLSAEELGLERSVPTPAPADPPTPARSITISVEERQQLAREAAEAERERVSTLSRFGEKFNARDKANEAIEKAWSVDQFRNYLWENGHTPSGSAAAGSRRYPSLTGTPGDLGLSERETQRYSLMRAIRAHVDKDWKGAEFERECSDAVAQQCGKTPSGFYVARDVLDSPIAASREAAELVARERGQVLQRDVTVAGGGASLVATNLLSMSFIEILRNVSVTQQMGAVMLPGLVGDVDIPRQSAAGSATWGGEDSAAPDADLATDLVQLRPKTLSAKSRLTRRLILQSTPAIEGLTRMDLAMAIGLGMDLAALTGSGIGAVPEGILNMAGVAVVPFGAPDGGPPTWANMVKLVSSVKKANAFRGTMGTVTSADGWGTLLSTPRVAEDSRMIVDEPGDSFLGRQLLASEQVPSNLVKGGSGATLSAAIFGNWNELLIGEWGVMDLLPDPYGDDAGGIVLRVFQDADVAARHEESFAVCLDMVTV